MDDERVWIVETLLKHPVGHQNLEGLGTEWKVHAPGESPMLYVQAMEKVKYLKNLYGWCIIIRVKDVITGNSIPEELL